MGLETNEAATCKFSVSPGASYASMVDTFGTTGGTEHSHQALNFEPGSYLFYVRCMDTEENVNTDDYTISWSIAQDSSGNLMQPVRQTGGAGVSRVSGGMTVGQ